MKMHLVYIAVSVLLLGNSPAFAQEQWPKPDCQDQGQTGQCDDVDQDDQDQQGQQDQNGQTDQDHPDQNMPDHPQLPQSKVYYNWGHNQHGFGYCYAFDRYGNVLDFGRPQSNMHCERVRRSLYNWGRAANGYIYCYQWTPYWAVLNDGRPVHPGYCR